MIILEELIAFGLLFLIYFLSMRHVTRHQFLNKYKIILDIQDHFLNTAYQVIYNDQLIAYTSQGMTNVQKDQLETIERNFIKLALELMGPNNERIIIEFFGDRQSAIKNMVIYFRRKLEQDEISKLLRSKMAVSNE